MDPTRIHEWEHPALKLKKNDRIIVNNQECTFLDYTFKPYNTINVSDSL